MSKLNIWTGRLEVDEGGVPIKENLMPQYVIPGLEAYPTKVRDSQWAGDPKPYIEYPIRKRYMHSSIEAHYLYTRPRVLGDGNYANLGVFKGFSTACFAYGLKEIKAKGKVYGVDLYNFIPLEEIAGYFTDLKIDKYLEICKGYTQDWPEKLQDKKFKFIFIDADHNYDSCKRDFELWHPLLEDEGQIAFHDVNLSTVAKVVNEIEQEWELVDHYAKIKSFKRRK